MAASREIWSKEEISILIQAYKDMKKSADRMTTNRELYSSIKGLLEQHNDVQCFPKRIKTKAKKLKPSDSKLKDLMKVSRAEWYNDLKSLTSVEKVACQLWDKLDHFLGKLSYVTVK